MISFPEILFRLAVALILGAAVGFEREQKDHEAGLRTLALVSLGCALFTIIDVRLRRPRDLSPGRKQACVSGSLGTGQSDLRLIPMRNDTHSHLRAGRGAGTGR